MAIDGGAGPAPGAIRITAEQRRRFDGDGYFLVEDALAPAEVAELLRVVDELDGRVRRERGLGTVTPVRVNNIACRDAAFRRLLDHPVLLPLVVDCLGPRIQLRGSNLDVRPPQSRPEHTAGLGAADSFFPWHRDAPDGGWPTVDGIVPFLELKVGCYLTDLTEPESGALCVVRGSHRRVLATGPDGEPRVDPADIDEIRVRPGTAIVWRTSLLHCVSPNFSDRARRCLYLAYQHRWLRPSDYLGAPADVLAACSPIQRQLLGSGAHRALELHDPEVEACSPHWTPGPESVPLEAWARRQGLRAGAGVHDVDTRDRG